ncbi:MULTISPECIES: hypothetical protein [unclassified Streptomyces]|uniref:hypothetical protein n=1 Tax=unclassified Streptomyces TaxID=2593676 RepID=UPI0037F5AB79
MITTHRPHSREGREGAVLLAVFLVAALELTALRLAPSGLRPGITGFLLGVSIAVLAMTAVLAHRHRRIAVRHQPSVSPESVDASWFTARTLDGFPMEAVRPLLLGPDAPDLNRLYMAWVLALHGHDTAWIVGRLGLPHDVAALLVDAAEARHSQG